MGGRDRDHIKFSYTTKQQSEQTRAVKLYSRTITIKQGEAGREEEGREAGREIQGMLQPNGLLCVGGECGVCNVYMCVGSELYVTYIQLYTSLSK